MMCAVEIWHRCFRLLPVVVAAGVLGGGRLGARAGSAPSAGLERFYIGTAGATSAISQASLDLGAGTFGPTNLAGIATNASFVALHPNHKFLYAVNDGGNFVVAFSIDPTTKNLTRLNQLPSDGSTPVDLVVDNAGKNVVVANYGGGSVSVFSLKADGSLGSETSHIQHPNPNPPTPHAHGVALDASNHFAVVCDLGLDKVFCYHYDSAQGLLTTNNPFGVNTPTGAGPRHVAFDLQCQHAYVICELKSLMIAYNYDAQNGILTPFQTNSTLPPGINVSSNAAAEVVVHPSGKFVYGSNRANNGNGTNTIVVYTVNSSSGALTMVQQQPVNSDPQKDPRNFAVDPTGAYCIVASQYVNNVLLFSINPNTGLLTPTGQNLSVFQPECVLPFFTQPPQPVLGAASAANGTRQVGIGNACSALTYQLYQAPALTSHTAWTLLATGACGQTNFTLTNGLPQSFLRAAVLTNY